ncbi:MAG: hypothetical protein Fur007_03820 [Rhodoferax sp.]
MDTPKTEDRSMIVRESFRLTASDGLWRVAAGALRIDSAPPGEAGRFMRLALPGDVIGVEQWAGTDDRLVYAALTPVQLNAMQPPAAELMGLLMDTVVVAHQRCREVVTLRTGPVSQRVKALLLLFAETLAPEAQSLADWPLPQLSDMADILDAAPETVSRVFSSMRKLDWVQARKPQQARFDVQALRTKLPRPGMTISALALRGLT